MLPYIPWPSICDVMCIAPVSIKCKVYAPLR